MKNNLLTRKLWHCLALCLALLAVPGAHAQEAAGADTTHLFWVSGKIYVAIAVLSIIFTGIVVYLVMLDRKLNRLEQRMNSSS